MAVGLDLDQYHFVKRVVLVFSPSGRDVRYEEQRLYLEDDTGEVDSWNLEVFGIFEDGPSFAAERALSREEAQAARERFGGAEANFALSLRVLAGLAALRP